MGRSISHILLNALIALMVLTSSAQAMARGQMAWGDGATLCLGAEQVRILTDGQGMPILDEDGAPVTVKHACLDCHLVKALPQGFDPAWQAAAIDRLLTLPEFKPRLTKSAGQTHKQARAPPFVM